MCDIGIQDRCLMCLCKLREVPVSQISIEIVNSDDFTDNNVLLYQSV